MLRAETYEPVIRFDLARSTNWLGLYWTTCYYVDETLIDTGCAHTQPELSAWMEDKPVRRIVNTHSHEDHIGANGWFQRRQPGLEILAHPLALPILRDPKRQRLHPYRRIFWGWPQPSQGKPVQDNECVETQNYRFQFIFTPGHSKDHYCLYEADQGWLFTGDLFVGGRDKALRGGYDILQIISSLKKIAALPVNTLFPGSARVRTNPTQDIMDKIAYLEETGEKVYSLHQNGMSENEIARRLFGKPQRVEMITLGHFSRRNLVRSYLGKNQED